MAPEAATRRIGPVTALVLLAGCLTEPGALSTSPAPVIESAVASPGPGNVMSAVVVVRLRHADSAMVRFGTARASALDSATPAVRVEEDSALIPVLGLLPGTAY